MKQPVGVVDQFGCSAAFRAESLTGGMTRVRLERDETSVIDYGERTAARHAKRAENRNTFTGYLFYHNALTS